MDRSQSNSHSPVSKLYEPNSPAVFIVLLPGMFCSLPLIDFLEGKG
jgi:hypothetical protein